MVVEALTIQVANYRAGGANFVGGKRPAGPAGRAQDLVPSGRHAQPVGLAQPYAYAFFIPAASFTASATPFSLATAFTFALSAPLSDFNAPRY